MFQFQRFAAALFAIAASTSVSAQNLLANPNFTTDLTGWTVKTTGAATVTFSSDTGSPAQGSVRLTATNGETAQLVQCVALSDSTVDLIVREFVVTSLAIQSAGADVTAYDQTACVGNPLGFFAFNPMPVDGFANGAPVSGWNELSALHQDLSNLHPLSALISVHVTAAAGGDANYYFDDVRFGASGTLPVRLQSFDVR